MPLSPTHAGHHRCSGLLILDACTLQGAAAISR